MVRHVDAARNPGRGDSLCAVTSRSRVRFSVYFGPGVRAADAVLAILMVAIGAALLTVHVEPGEEWYRRALAAIPLVTTVLLLEGLLFDISLYPGSDRLVKRGVWRWSADLRKARFRLVETSWEVMVRLSPLNVKKYQVTAPTLVVRSGLWRIRLPLARRFGHPVVNGLLVRQWLPHEQLGALADAIERSATAENKAKVVNYLRQLQLLSAEQDAAAPAPQP